MDTHARPAAFRLSGYKITRFSLEEYEGAAQELLLEFIPSGELDVEKKIYRLSLKLHVFIDTPKDVSINKPELAAAELVADFEFREPVTAETIPDYFYANALAIVFPYLRSFISTLTQQANIKSVLLPIMNLSGLEPALRAETKEI